MCVCVPNVSVHCTCRSLSERKRIKISILHVFNVRLLTRPLFNSRRGSVISTLLTHTLSCIVQVSVYKWQCQRQRSEDSCGTGRVQNSSQTHTVHLKSLIKKHNKMGYSYLSFSLKTSVVDYIHLQVYLCYMWHTTNSKFVN